MYVTSPVKAFESDIPMPVFGLSENTQERLQEISLSEGDSLFFDGDDADYVYEVIKGVLRSSKVLMDGRRQVVNFCYPGEMVGISHDSRYHFDCHAVSPAKLRVYRKNAFLHDVASDPEFFTRLLTNAAAEMNSMQDHFLMLGRKTAMEKLASFLIAVMERTNSDCRTRDLIELPMKRSDIADFLGMTIETVSRNLTRLRKLGVIDLPSTHLVQVLNPSELRSMAENCQ